MGRPVGDGYDVDLAVDVIAVLKTERNGGDPRGLEDDRAFLAPLVARMLAIRNTLDRPKSTSASSLKPLS
jgi:hypothetical protein